MVIYMKYLIFSDSHRATLGMRSVITRCIDGLDGVIFLGDHYDDTEFIAAELPELTLHAVAGNCDISSKYLAPEYREKILCLDGVRVLITHGHGHGVKWGLGPIEQYARAKGVDAVLFGHTHERVERYSDGLYIFNPGSVSQPRDGTPSFGVLTVQDGQILLSHGNVY